MEYADRLTEPRLRIKSNKGISMNSIYALPLVALLALCSVSCVSVRDLVYHPGDKGLLSNEVLTQRNFESLELTTTDNETIHTLYYKQPDTELLSVYFHGNGGNVHQRVAVLKKLASLGTSVLAISYRGYPLSTGVPSEKGLIIDAKTAISHANTVLGYSNDNIVLIGRSLGSSVATFAASDSSFHGLILISPFTNARDLYDAQSSFKKLLLKNEDNFIDSSFRNSEIIPSVISPTLVIHGTDDRLIPYELGEKLYSNLKSRKKLLTLKGAGHNNFGYTNTSENDQLYWHAIQDVLDENW